MAALRRAEINLENEYARSEAPVTTMMPPSIATRLKVMPDQRIADRIECLSILFADLVPLHSDYDSLVWASRRVAGCG